MEGFFCLGIKKPRISTGLIDNLNTPYEFRDFHHRLTT